MGFANKISLSRILVIPFFIAALFYYAYHHDPLIRWVAVVIFCYAMISDFIDGAIARVKKQKTELGKLLDPLADKLFLLNAFIWLYHLRGPLPLDYSLPIGVVIIVVSRDLLILLGILILHLLKIQIQIAPNVWGKLTTFLQLFTILSVLLNFFFSPIVWNLAAVFTVISGLVYLKRGINAFNELDRKNHTSAGN